MSGANTDGDPDRFVISTRWIPEKGDSGQAYFSLSAWILPSLSLGFDYRPLVGDVGPIGNWRAMTEDPDGWRPAVIFGGSTDDFTIDGEEEKSVVGSVALAKSILEIPRLDLNFAPYVGAAYIDALDEVRAIGGLGIQHPELSVMWQYSGTDTHLTVTRRLNHNVSLSFIHWGLRYPGVGMRVTF